MSAARRTRPPDPGTVCRDLCRMASEDALPRLLLILPPPRGEEEGWFAERVLQEVLRAARQAEVDLLELDAGSPDFGPEPVEAFLGSQSLFAGRRVLVLARAGKALGRWPRLVEALGRAAQDPTGPSPLVVHCGTLAAGTRKKLQQLARKAGRDGSVQVHGFRRLYSDPPPWNPDPDESEAGRFASAEARERGMRLGRGAAGLLVELAGGRPGDLVRALEHFELLGLREIGEEEVRQVVAHGAEGSAFSFAEALLTGDTRAVLRDLQRLRARGLRSWDGRRLGPAEAFSMLVAATARERMRTVQVLEGLAAGLDIQDACRAAGVAAGGPPAQRMRRRLRSCDAGHLQAVLAGLREVERQVKLEGWSPLLALEALALRLRPGRTAARTRGGA